MVIEHAICYLNALKKEALDDYESYPRRAWALDTAIAALREQEKREQEKRENPKPLTLEELRHMGGEPVWMQDNHGIKAWGLVSVFNDGSFYCIDCDNGIWDGDFYGNEIAKDGWIAYRSKPKEAN